MKAIGLAALAGAMFWTAVTPASAEFFGCNEPRSKVSYSSQSTRQAYQARAHAPSQSSQQYSTQRTRSAGLFAPYQSRSERW